MPSSITLTVSHLPRSTSFFLSSLQPLDYVYRGRTDNTIGFGSALNLSAPPDFWITQEVPGVPAGAAHVAFPASSHRRVERFFTAALKAGGKIHGEPAIRDSSGYYSAAVIDFDGNSIEAVFRPTFSDDKENTSAKSSISRKAPSDFDRSFRDRAREKAISGDILDNIFAEVRSAADLARKAMKHVRPTPTTYRSEPLLSTSNSSGNAHAVVSTLLGVAAGAAMTYAFSASDSKDDHSDQYRRAHRSMAGANDVASHPSGSSISRGRGSHRNSPPSEDYVTVEEIEYRSSHPPHSRRHSTSGIPLADYHDNRSSSSSQASSNRSRFQPIRMIEAPPSSPSHHSASRSHNSGSQTSTIKPHRQASMSGSERSSKTKSYPPSAFPGGYPTPPSSVSTARRQPLPLSRSNSSYHSNGQRSRSMSRRQGQPDEYPVSPSRRNSTYNTPDDRSTGGKSSRGSIMDEEVRPEDSISQVSFSGSRSGSRRRRR